MPSFFEISPPVLEKIFEGFLPNMGMADILVMLTSLFIHTSIDASHKIWLWALISQAVSEEMFAYYGNLHV